MIYVGTCGYSYKDWIGPFYPEGTKDSQMLEHYSYCFNFAEINSSFYHMPKLQLFDSIVKRTPDNFKVAVKLFQSFTHFMPAKGAAASTAKSASGTGESEGWNAGIRAAGTGKNGTVEKVQEGMITCIQKKN